MLVINARNVHEALPIGLDYLERDGVQRDSRAGKVLVYPGPVTTLYNQPRERVIFWEERDANPFFHLMESLWMLAGRNDVEFVSRYVARMKTFSDDGETLHGAYGHRWLRHFTIEDPERRLELNQVATIANMLRRNPEERRCVLGMWDPSVDLGRDGKDVPCNTQAFFSRGSGGELNMTVCNRSNDAIWGAYGANAVHFSVLQEFMAAMIGCEVGRYWQVSNNFHAYLNTFQPLQHLADKAPCPYRIVQQNISPYALGEVSTFPLVSTPIEQWLQDLGMFLEEGVVIGLRDPFFRRVVAPLETAHSAYKSGEPLSKCISILERCEATDWRRAAEEWLQRRYKGEEQ